MTEYKDNIQKLFCTLRRVLHPKTLFIWTTALPISQQVRGGVILEEIRFLSEVLRYDVLLANDYSSRVAARNGFDVLDLHYSMRRYIPWRLTDVIHWNEIAHRKVTGIILHHICTAWSVILPTRIGYTSNPRVSSPRPRHPYTGYKYATTSSASDSEEHEQSTEKSSLKHRSSLKH